MNPQQVFATLIVSLVFSCHLCQCLSYQKLSPDGRHQSVEAGNSTRVVRVKLTKNEELDTLAALRKAQRSIGQADDGTKFGKSISLNSLMIGLVKIGTPAQEFRFVFDLDSSFMWIPSVKCKNCGKKRRYDSSKSSTYIKNGTKIHTDNDDKGFGSSDKVVLGDIEIKEQMFAEMLKIGKQFEGDTPYDGLFCLGDDDYSGGIPTPLKSMLQQGLIDQEVFTVYQNPDQVASPGGEIAFGGVDKSHYAGDLVYLTRAYEGMWAISVDEIAVAGGQVKACVGSCIARLDTATSFIIGSRDEVGPINKALGAQIDDDASGLYVLPDCDLSKLANLQFTLGRKTLELTPAQYIMKVQNAGKEICVSTLIAPSLWFGDWIFGTPFIGHIYTVFDQKNKQMGFAQAV